MAPRDRSLLSNVGRFVIGKGKDLLPVIARQLAAQQMQGIGNGGSPVAQLFVQG